MADYRAVDDRVWHRHVSVAISIGNPAERVGAVLWRGQPARADVVGFGGVAPDTGCGAGGVWLLARCGDRRNWRARPLADDALDGHFVWPGRGSAGRGQYSFGHLPTGARGRLVYAVP